jgi:hypothetical protein
MAQGYLFSHPKPASQVAHLLLPAVMTRQLDGTSSSVA